DLEPGFFPSNSNAHRRCPRPPLDCAGLLGTPGGGLSGWRCSRRLQGCMRQRNLSSPCDLFARGREPRMIRTPALASIGMILAGAVFLPAAVLRAENSPSAAATTHRAT